MTKTDAGLCVGAGGITVGGTVGRGEGVRKGDRLTPSSLRESPHQRIAPIVLKAIKMAINSSKAKR
jgi:hypothetical protein